jgi:hypothetical protein
MGQSVS